MTPPFYQTVSRRWFSTASFKTCSRATPVTPAKLRAYRAKLQPALAARGRRCHVHRVNHALRFPRSEPMVPSSHVQVLTTLPQLSLSREFNKLTFRITVPLLVTPRPTTLEMADKALPKEAMLAAIQIAQAPRLHTFQDRVSPQPP